MNFECSEDNLTEVLLNLKENIHNKNIIVLLQGDLASGKTTLVKQYVSYLGLNDRVSSPTFSLQYEYGDNIYHYDMYNKTLDEFISLGMLEEFEKIGTHFVEWGDEQLEKILKEYGFNTCTVKIHKLTNKRRYFIES